MFLGPQQTERPPFVSGWRSVYCRPTLRYRRVVYQNLTQRRQPGTARESSSRISLRVRLRRLRVAPYPDPNDVELVIVRPDLQAEPPTDDRGNSVERARCLILIRKW